MCACVTKSAAGREVACTPVFVVCERMSESAAGRESAIPVFVVFMRVAELAAGRDFAPPTPPSFKSIMDSTTIFKPEARASRNEPVPCLASRPLPLCVYPQMAESAADAEARLSSERARGDAAMRAAELEAAARDADAKVGCALAMWRVCVPRWGVC
eukprot:166300-Chlamydomonas_euryale.AAC.2